MEQLDTNSLASSQRLTPGETSEDGAILVTVIIPAFNAADTIVRALDSVRAQNIPELEIIVIDDGSADNTISVVSENAQPGENLRLLRLEKNSGVSAARNAGISVAKGRFLAFLDADDIWLPGKLDKQIAAMASDDKVTLVSCNSQLVTEAGTPIKVGHLNRPPIEGDDAWKTLLIYNFLPTPTILTRTQIVKEIGGFDETLAVGEDLDLWIRLGLRGKIIVLKEILTNYYDRAGSLMKRHNGQTGDIVVPMLERHITEQKNRLSGMEIRRIRGCRSFQIGCNLFFSGSYRECIPIFAKAILYGWRPFKSFLYIPRAICMEFITKLRAFALSSAK